MISQLNTRAAIVVAVLLLSFGLIVAGPAGAQSGDGFEVDVQFPGDENEDEEFTAENNQTIEVHVTNNADSELVSPLIEIPINSDFDVNGSSEGVGSITVTRDVDGAEETDTINSEIDDSTFRSGNALFIEGVGVESGETNAYEISIDVDSPGDVDVQTDVRPLNNEANNDRATYTGEALGFGTIDVGTNTDVTITGENTEISDSSDFEADVIADREYTVAGDISILDDDLEVTGVQPELFNTDEVWFSDVSDGNADEPTVVGRTASGVDIVNVNDRIDRGNAETPTTQDVEYTLISDGGEVYIVLEDQDDLDPRTDEVEISIDDGDIEEIEDADGLTLVQITSDGDTDGTFEFVGYPVGDVDEDGDVTGDDATAIAEAAASGDLDSINRYGDVTDNDEVSVVDAMFIQQYLENNRDADYERGGGS